MAVNKINVNRHPASIYIEHLRDYCQSFSSDLTLLSMKTYTYIPSSLSDPHKEFRVVLSEVNTDWLDNKIKCMRPSEELAINSKVYFDHDVSRYIPMVDLGISKFTSDIFGVINDFMSQWNMDFFVFDSGRSMHLYGKELLDSHDVWVKFMGSLLLLNQRGGRNIIDTRWVGHRLLGGQSSLRWSNNTMQYKRYPVYIGMLSELIHIK